MIHKRLLVILMVFAVTLTLCGLSFAVAETATGSVVAGATVSSTAKLDVDISAVTFLNADPDTTTVITASEGPITITAKAKTSNGSPVNLTVLAGGDLISSSTTTPIPISNVTWTASSGAGGGFVAGTLSKTTPKTVASWTGSGNRTGSVTFKLNNTWNYDTGSYSATLIFTLTSP